MRAIIVAGLLMASGAAAHADTIRLHAAGSLKAALTDVARAFEKSSGGQHSVETTFGASGLLRERIENGEPTHVFASANTSHPKQLVDSGKAEEPVRVFARNELCALTRGGLSVPSDKLLETMLAPATKLGTSTPKADPAGDYAFALFAKAEALKTGSTAQLQAKALQLTGGPNSPKPTDGRSVYAWVMTSGQADVFLTYCTNAALAKAEAPELGIVDIPEELNVGASYGLVVIKGMSDAARSLADFILAPSGQSILANYGFKPGG